MTSTPPLLVAMEGRKPRARRERAPVPRESKLHTRVAELLRDHCLPDWRWTFISRKAKDAREGAILKRMGVKPGWSDFQIISPDGVPHFLELKRIGEDIEEGSPQEQFRDWCIECGIPHAVAWTIDQVLFEFDRWGCLRIEYQRRSSP
jgi:hypothetical protein